MAKLKHSVRPTTIKCMVCKKVLKYKSFIPHVNRHHKDN